MWILRKLTNSDTIFRIISSKGTYTVGRKNKDIVLDDDTSISRNHCTIKIAKSGNCPFTVDTATGVWVIDEGSKYGTFIKQNDYVKLKTNVPQKLEKNCIVRFGLMDNVYRLEYKPILICTSMLSKEENEECRKIISEIDGCLKNNWDSKCSCVIVNNVTLTKKVVLALINGVPVVLRRYLRELADSIINSTPEPDYKAFKPPIGEKALKGNLVSLDVNVTRKDLFKGKLFVIPTKNQYENLKEIIAAAGGKVEILEANCNWHKFGGETTVIVKYPLDAPAAIVNEYKKNGQMLKDKYGKRIVPENEIAQAIAYSSIEKFCNPKCEFNVHKSFEESSKGEVIEEETPTISEQMLEEGSVSLVPGSNTQSDSEPNSISVLDVIKPGFSNNRKRALSPEIPTPTKKRMTESATPSQFESQSLMTNSQTPTIEKTNNSKDKNDSNKKNVEKRASVNRPIIQIENDPMTDDFWQTPSSSQANQTNKRKKSDDKSPPRVEPASKKTKTTSDIPNNWFDQSTSKNNDKSKRSRKSPSPNRALPRAEQAKRSKTVMDNILESSDSSKNDDKSKNGRKSPTPKPSTSFYDKTTISNKILEDDEGWITLNTDHGDWKEENEVKTASLDELNSTVVMLNLVSISYKEEGGIKEPPCGLKNVKKFKKQKLISPRENVPVQQVEIADDDDDDWTYLKPVGPEMI